MIESRLARPHFYAVPRRSATDAVAKQWIAAEAAVAKSGQGAATSFFDLAKFYESITALEVLNAVVGLGLPKWLASLIVHMYLGARAIQHT